MTPAFSIEAALRFGWERTKKYFLTLIVIGIAVFIISAIPSMIAGWARHNGLVALLGQLVGMVLQILVSIAVTKAVLLIHDDRKPTVDAVIPSGEVVVNYIIGSLIYGAIVVAGFILLIVPGIIWGIKYKMYSYLIIDKGMGAMDAIKKSGEITMGNKWYLFLFGIVSAIVCILGALALGIGLLVAIPVVTIAHAYIYRILLHAKPAAPASVQTM